MPKKSILVVTRRMLAAVERRIKYDYDVRFNANDRLYIRDELMAKSDRADALLSTQRDQMDADLISRCGSRGMRRPIGQRLPGPPSRLGMSGAKTFSLIDRLALGNHPSAAPRLRFQSQAEASPAATHQSHRSHL